MTNRMAKESLGCQIWLEPSDSAERVDLLFRRGAESGLGWARIFLMWPWLEPVPGEWNFDLFDHAFASAARHGLKRQITRLGFMNELRRRVFTRIGRVQAFLVGQDDEGVCFNQIGDQRTECVVVAKLDFVVDDRAVLIDDRNHPAFEQRAQGRAGSAVALAAGQTGVFGSIELA